MFQGQYGLKSYPEGEEPFVSSLEVCGPIEESILGRGGKSSMLLHYFNNKTLIVLRFFLLKTHGHAALPIIKGGSFSDPSALQVSAYVSQTFSPLTPECFWSESSDRPQSGDILRF